MGAFGFDKNVLLQVACGGAVGLLKNGKKINANNKTTNFAYAA